MPTKQRRDTPTGPTGRPTAPGAPTVLRKTGREHLGTSISYNNEGAGKIFRPTREGGIVHTKD